MDSSELKFQLHPLSSKAHPGGLKSAITDTESQDSMHRGRSALRARLGQPMLTTSDLLEEAAISQYALHANLHLQHIKPVWRDLWQHVASHLLAGKVRDQPLLCLTVKTSEIFSRNACVAEGVQLPSLGSILLQPSGAGGQLQLGPVLYSATSLGARFLGNMGKLAAVSTWP